MASSINYFLRRYRKFVMKIIKFALATDGSRSYYLEAIFYKVCLILSFFENILENY